MRKKKFLGVHSARSKDFKGSTRKRLFFAWSTEADLFEVQRLDGTYKPVAEPETVDRRTFEALYVYEPSILAAPVGGSAGGKDSAETAPAVAASGAQERREVEKHLRGHFRKAMQRLRRREEKYAALQALQTLVEVEEGIQPEHKHMFADFGIDLRRSKEYPLALAFCRRVLQLAPDDDHAHFNTARVLLEMGNMDAAEDHLLTAMDMMPGTLMYERMLEYLLHERRRRQRPGAWGGSPSH